MRPKNKAEHDAQPQTNDKPRYLPIMVKIAGFILFDRLPQQYLTRINAKFALSWDGRYLARYPLIPAIKQHKIAQITKAIFLIFWAILAKKHCI